MPGHIKKSTGPDPDPSPWLIVSDELKVKLKSKPYDPKKSCWVPNKGTGGYDEGLIESADGDKVSVKLLEGGEVSIESVLLCKINLDMLFGFYSNFWAENTEPFKKEYFYNCYSFLWTVFNIAFVI